MENSSKITRITTVKNELGMHARPASKIAQIVAPATSDIWLRVDDELVDASSIIDILTLCAVKGTQVEVAIDSAEDLEILEAIVAYFEDGFGEK